MKKNFTFLQIKIRGAKRRGKYETAARFAIFSAALIASAAFSAFPIAAAFAADSSNYNLDGKNRIIREANLQAPDEWRSVPILNWQGTSNQQNPKIQSFSSQSSTQLQPSANTVSGSSAASGSSETLGPNLIINPDLTTPTSDGRPSYWYKGGYGSNTRTYEYPVPGNSSSNYGIKVSLSNYQSGDAKWFFYDVPVVGGETYQFSDYSISDVSSIIDLRFRLTNDTYTYSDVAAIPPHSSFALNSVRFTIPPNVKSVTVFHLINSEGFLTTSGFSLNKISAPSGGGSNLVANGDFEMAASNGLPENWRKGGWGSNTAVFSYPATGANNSTGAKVAITDYTSGDAKWYFAPIPADTGIYTYSEDYQSDIPSVVNVQIHNSDGSYTYKDLAYLSPAPDFTPAKIGFTVPQGTIDITVFHLIKQKGYLRIDNVSLVKNNYSSGIFSTGAVTLTFDDGSLSQFQNAIPQLDKFGQKGTFYIITRELSDYGYSAFLSKDQIKQMYADGQEIGAHTRTHPYLSKLTDSQLEQEVSGSRDDLLALNVGPINSFAYPFGDYDARSIQMVEQAGYTNARSTITGYAIPSSDIYQIPRYVVNSSTSLSEMESWVDQAIAGGFWLIIEMHQVDNSGTYYSITPQNFAALSSYLNDKGVPVITMQQGVSYLGQ